MGHVLQERDPLSMVGGQGQTIWQKLSDLQKWTVGGISRKLRVVGSEEDTFEFREARIVGGDAGAGVGVMSGLMA